MTTFRGAYSYLGQSRRRTRKSEIREIRFFSNWETVMCVLQQSRCNLNLPKRLVQKWFSALKLVPMHPFGLIFAIDVITFQGASGYGG